MNQIELFSVQGKSRKNETALPFKRVRDERWDFRSTTASSFVYGIHPYPAMFHFMVVRELIQKYSQEGDLVLDPFLGSGVTAVECLCSNRSFIGYDINPLAVLVAGVRITPLPQAKLLDATMHIESQYKKNSPEPVAFHNIDYWFDSETRDDLSRLRTAIFEIDDQPIAHFLKVAFSEVVRRVSRTSYNEFKLVRQKGKLKKWDVLKTFRDVSLRNISLLTDFYKTHPARPLKMALRNENILHSDLKDHSVDLMVTSPPYGDSRTTVAYGQFSRLSLRWLGLEERVDRTSLGAKAKGIEQDLPSAILYEYLNRITAKDEKRAREVYSFYHDLHAAVTMLAKKLKFGGFACFVVGNRTVKGEQLPTDKISADFFEDCGFAHLQTWVRAISNKRMPSENSPSNIRGQKDSTMRQEYIVVLQRKA